MLDHGNGQLSAVGFFNPGVGQAPVGEFFGGGISSGVHGVFELGDGKVLNCFLVAGRRLVKLSGGSDDKALQCLAAGASPQDGHCIYATVVQAQNGTLSLDVSDGASVPDNTLDRTHRLLYLRRDGQWIDCRWMPVIVMCE